MLMDMALWVRSHHCGGSSVVRTVLLLWLGILLEVAAALSGCQRCDQTGDCSHAYNNGPGQFCGHWLDRANQQQSCCCPLDAQCRVSNYACNCLRVVRSRPDDGVADPLLWLWWLLGALAIAACCGGCLYLMFVHSKRNRYDDDGDGVSPVPVAYPVGAPPGTPTTVYGPVACAPHYGTTPLYTTPAYPTPAYATPGYVGGGSYGRSGMGAGTGAALGGAAGLLGGLVLGEALADAGNHGYSHSGGGGFSGGGGDAGAGGGYDAGVGDFGGDF